MSIASEISRLQSAKAAIKAAIEAKGVTVLSSAKLGDYAQLIGEIETGGGAPSITLELSQVVGQDPLVIQLTSEQAEIVESTDALMPITVDATALNLGVSTYVMTLDPGEFCLVENLGVDGVDMWYANMWIAIYDSDNQTFTVEYHAGMAEGGGGGDGGYDEIAEMEFGTTYTVTFNSMGGSSVSSQTVYTGRPASEPTAPTKTSYSFGGWYADQECTEEFDFDTSIDADITLYAKWGAPGYSGSIYATPINYMSYYGVFTKIKFDSAPTDDDDYDAYADTNGTLNGASSFTDEHKIYVWGSSESAGGSNRALPSMVPTNCVMIGEDTWEGGISYDVAVEVTLSENGNIGLAFAAPYINGGGSN